MIQKLIAPCGMNCGICKAFLRRRNPCHGCNDAGQNKPETRVHCILRVCDKRRGSFCFDCPDFPCPRLRHMDWRYQTRYGMSEIENLKFIRDHGIREFLVEESRKWVRKEGILCVHDRQIYSKPKP
jgi:hypothetical protein